MFVTFRDSNSAPRKIRAEAILALGHGDRPGTTELDVGEHTYVVAETMERVEQILAAAGETFFAGAPAGLADRIIGDAQRAADRARMEKEGRGGA